MRIPVEQIPLTKAALEQQARRAAYQGGHVWVKHKIRILSFSVIPLGGLNQESRGTIPASMDNVT